MRPKYFILIFTLLAGCTNLSNTHELITPFEKGNGNQTATYQEAIQWWKSFSASSPWVKMIELGSTDSGEPLHLVLMNKSANFNWEHLQERGVPLLLINNGIHPGEPDGIDASMLVARDLLTDEKKRELLDDVIVAFIPVYNIGGARNRNCCTRANQDGPEAYGFRGNARNLDLNRDFIKADSRNAQRFIELVATLDPDVYLETHVSNGADYPYTLTYLFAHHAKQTPPLDTFIPKAIEQHLTQWMKAADEEIIPYVNVFGTSPDAGITMFYDSPRYSTGFLSLRQSISLLTETHMLKPFPDRVDATYKFMHALVARTSELGAEVKQKRKEARQFLHNQQRFDIAHIADMKHPDMLLFKGFKAQYDTSAVTGQLQLHYDRSQTWTDSIPFYTRLIPTSSVECPSAYLVPAAWKEVIERLQWNGVEMQLLEHDTLVDVTRYRILDYDTKESPYEGHYLHSNTRVAAEELTLDLRSQAYYLVPTDQKLKRFLVETLEPNGPDSYFNWNFFDEVLQQKEWFSSYVFEAEAAEMIKQPKHKEALAAFIAQNPEAKEDAFAQLYFLYKRSPHFESDQFMVYPVYRIDDTD